MLYSTTKTRLKMFEPQQPLCICCVGIPFGVSCAGLLTPLVMLAHHAYSGGALFSAQTVSLVALVVGFSVPTYQTGMRYLKALQYH